MATSSSNIYNYNGDQVYPQIIASQVLDLVSKVVTNGDIQNNIQGHKDFVDGLSINGKRVLVDGDVFANAIDIPNGDIFNITSSGLYHYDGTEKNLPVLDGEYHNGFIFSIFTKDSNYGILLFIGGLVYIEKYQGKWRSVYSGIPVKLWSGAAKLGDTAKLKASIKSFSSLEFILGTTMGQIRLRGSSIANGTCYVTQVGQTGDGKNTRSIELTLHSSSDGQSITIAQVLFNTAPGSSEQIKTAVLQTIFGVRG